MSRRRGHGLLVTIGERGINAGSPPACLFDARHRTSQHLEECTVLQRYIGMLCALDLLSWTFAQLAKSDARLLRWERIS